MVRLEYTVPKIQHTVQRMLYQHKIGKSKGSLGRETLSANHWKNSSNRTVTELLKIKAWTQFEKQQWMHHNGSKRNKEEGEETDFDFERISGIEPWIASATDIEQALDEQDLTEKEHALDESELAEMLQIEEAPDTVDANISSPPSLVLNQAQNGTQQSTAMNFFQPEALFPKRVAGMINSLLATPFNPIGAATDKNSVKALMEKRQMLFDVRAAVVDLRGYIEMGASGLDVFHSAIMDMVLLWDTLHQEVRLLMTDTWSTWTEDELRTIGSIKEDLGNLWRSMLEFELKPHTGYYQYWMLTRWMSQYLSVIEMYVTYLNVAFMGQISPNVHDSLASSNYMKDCAHKGGGWCAWWGKHPAMDWFAPINASATTL